MPEKDQKLMHTHFVVDPEWWSEVRAYAMLNKMTAQNFVIMAVNRFLQEIKEGRIKKDGSTSK